MAIVSKAWLKDFDVVTDYYQLLRTGEREWFRQKCKNEMSAMGPWVTREAAWIKAGCPVEIQHKGRRA